MCDFQERAVFGDDSLGFSITDQYLEENINSSTTDHLLVLNAERRELTFRLGEEGAAADTVHYWRLPHQFLGNKVCSCILEVFFTAVWIRTGRNADPVAASFSIRIRIQRIKS